MRTKPCAGVCLGVFACLMMAACTQTQVITALEAAVTAAQAALPAVSTAAGVSPSETAALVDYLENADTALGKVSSDLQAGGNTASVAAEVSADLAGVIAAEPNLAGLPAAVAAAVQSVAAQVQQIAAEYGAKSALSAGPRVKEAKVSFGRRDRARLAKIQSAAAGNITQIARWKAAH